jgi:hypothetical protein
MVTGDKWADELSAQLNKIRPKACICGILQAGERWISVPLPPPVPPARTFSGKNRMALDAVSPNAS